MNELIFFTHVIIILGMILGSLRLGKSALIASVCICTILANLFVQKQIMLFGFILTCSDAFMVGGILGLNLIHEYFGFNEARKTIAISFISTVFYTIFSQIHILYIPAQVDYTQKHFVAILNQMPRIIIASLFTYLLVQFWDTIFYRFLKSLFKGRYLTLRSCICLGISQFFDTVLFSFLGLWGMVESISGIIFMSYLIKLIVIALSAPFIALTKKFNISLVNNE